MTLSHAEARAVYDRLGAWLNSQAFYEDPVLAEMIAHGDFAQARSVFEFGCGTGRLAARLLANYLPPEASYAAIDVSPRMVALASARLAPWRGRVTITPSDGTPRLPLADGACARVVSTYVLDLLSDEDIGRFLAEARRVLDVEDGRLCLVSLSWGTTGVSRLVSRAWRGIHRIRPALLGGCRPIDLSRHLSETAWTRLHRDRLTRFGVTSEIIIARPRAAGEPAADS